MDKSYIIIEMLPPDAKKLRKGCKNCHFCRSIVLQVYVATGPTTVQTQLHNFCDRLTGVGVRHTSTEHLKRVYTSPGPLLEICYFT